MLRKTAIKFGCITVGAIICISLLFAFLGIYDNRSMLFALRTLFWISTITTGTITGVFLLPWLTRGAIKTQHFLIKLVLLSSLQVIPVPLVIALFSDGLASKANGGWSLQDWLTQYLMSVVIAIILNGCAYMFIKSQGWLTNQQEQSNNPEMTFMQRLPAKYHAADLYAVSSQDHYLQIHTSRGKEMILMRLSDALKELMEVDGMQIHRSWWVARNAIVESVKTKGKHSVLLKSGEQVPIARSYVKQAKQANLIG